MMQFRFLFPAAIVTIVMPKMSTAILLVGGFSPIVLFTNFSIL